VWAYGVLLWEIFSMGYMPYPGRNNHEVMTVVTAGGRLESPNGCPQAVYVLGFHQIDKYANFRYDLMKSCWATEARERPRFGDVVGRLLQLVHDPDIAQMPLPPVVHAMTVSTVTHTVDTTISVPSTTTTLSTTTPPVSTEPTDDGSNTLGGSGRTSFTSEPMPTRGTGVAESAAAPYQPQQQHQSSTSEYLLAGGSARSSLAEIGGPPVSTGRHVGLIVDEDEVFIVQPPSVLSPPVPAPPLTLPVRQNAQTASRLTNDYHQSQLL
jgi:hypothetical protein